MKRLTIFGIVTCILLLIVPASVIGGPAGPPGGLDVKIIDQPVEVTGTVDANITGDVNATIPGDVNVKGNVEITNTDPIPITDVGVSTCGRTHIRECSSGTFGDETPTITIREHGDHPGEVLVIETVSFRAIVPSTGSVFDPYIGVFVSDSGPAVQSFVLSLPTVVDTFPSIGVTTYTCTVPVKLVMRDNESVTLTFTGVMSELDNGSYRVCLHGYYTDATCPQP